MVSLWRQGIPQEFSGNIIKYPLDIIKHSDPYLTIFLIVQGYS